MDGSLFMSLRFLLIVSLICSTGCATLCLASEKEEPLALERRLYDGRIYSIVMPKEKPAEGYGLLVFLHASGARERQAFTLLGKDGTDRGMIVVGPAAKEKKWQTSGDDEAFVLALIDSLRKEYDVPRHKTIVAGFGGGAAAACRYIIANPDRAAFICAVNGFVSPKVLPSILRETKVDILALTAEFTPYRGHVENGVTALGGAGYFIKLGFMKGMRHSFLADQFNPVILDWFKERVKVKERKKR